MDALQFAYWLRGYFEINGEDVISKEKAEIISKHLTLVFEEKAKDLPPISTYAPEWPDFTLPLDTTILCSSIEEYREALDRNRAANTGQHMTTVSCRTAGKYC
jgi:hypothetical protein